MYLYAQTTQQNAKHGLVRQCDFMDSFFCFKNIAQLLYLKKRPNHLTHTHNVFFCGHNMNYYLVSCVFSTQTLLRATIMGHFVLCWCWFLNILSFFLSFRLLLLVWLLCKFPCSKISTLLSFRCFSVGHH